MSRTKGRIDMTGRLTPTKEQFAAFSMHELTSSLAIYDENWTHYHLTCKPEYFRQYVYERSRCKQEIETRLDVICDEIDRQEAEWEAEQDPVKLKTGDTWEILKMEIKSTREYNLENARYEESD
jgi:hypothetical protein